MAHRDKFKEGIDIQIGKWFTGEELSKGQWQDSWRWQSSGDGRQL